MPTLPAIYDELADWFHLLTTPSDYAEEAEQLLVWWRDAIDGPLATGLELGSGGGNLASHLGGSVVMTLSDLSPSMVDLSRTINPSLEHHVGDMRSLRLGRTFDAVLIHDAVMYLTTEPDLRAALDTAFEHCRPGGVTVVMPDHVRESFLTGTDHGGHDEHPDGLGRGLRYLEWSTDPDPNDTTYQVDYALLLREADGSHRVVYDQHIEGLFPRDTWLRLLGEAGFTPTVVGDKWGREVFIARRAQRPT